ncbi:MAG: helix-turn-helix domain-containing protein, partial [Bdellovibrionales bacterium]|nr:helix-turn-helix domain-containing protein [Bdellovibrionales bacterium]
TSDLPTFEELEHRYIQLVLQKTGGRKDRAADILGINRRTLYRKEKEMEGISFPESTEERMGHSGTL